jgi:hypothetical protein
MRLTVPATGTVHLDDAIGQLGELKELLSLLGGPWRFPSVWTQWGDKLMESNHRARQPNDRSPLAPTRDFLLR